MDQPAIARWWTVRRAQNRKPATYRCPFCGRHLPALSEHMLILPEGDASRRRHAHTECVLAERRRGRLPTREEWLKTQPPGPGILARLIERFTRHAVQHRSAEEGDERRRRAQGWPRGSTRRRGG